MLKQKLLHIVENIEVILHKLNKTWTVSVGCEGEALMLRAQRREKWR